MNKQLLQLSFILLFITASNYSHAQASKELGSWYVYNGFFNLSPKTELFVEGQWRTWEPISNTQNLFFRPFISYNFHPSFQLGLGQEYHLGYSFEEVNDKKNEVEEYRTTLQAILKQKLGRVHFQHRYRYEFRFVDHVHAQRTRYRLQLGIPITDKEMGKGVIFTTLGNEFLMNTKEEFKLVQNRTYAMLGYQVSKTTHVQGGYMYINNPNAEGLHRLQFFLTQKLDFYSK